MQRGGRRVHKGPGQRQIQIRDCSFLECAENRLWAGDVSAKGLTSVQGWRKQDWAEGELDCTAKAPMDAMSSSRTGNAFQSCPELKQGGQAFIPLHQSVIGCGDWVAWGRGQNLDLAGVLQPRANLEGNSTESCQHPTFPAPGENEFLSFQGRLGRC